MDTGSDTLFSVQPNLEGEEEPQFQLQPERHIAHLRTLQETSRKLNSGLELEDVLTNILDEAIRAIGAERGCLLLAGTATGDLELRLSRHLQPSDLDSRSFRPSRTVIEQVWLEGKPVLTANALKDPELAKADSVIHYALRSILCVPLHVQGERIGVLYLDNRLKVGQFQSDDLALAVAIADQAAVALNNAQLHREAVDRSRKLMDVLQHIQALNQISLKVQGLTNFPDLFAVIGRELERFGSNCAIALLNSDGTCLEIRYVSSGKPPHSGIVASGAEIPCVQVSGTVICRQVLEERGGQVVPDVSEVVTEFLNRPISHQCQPAFVAPLVANNRAIGLLVLGLDDGQHEDCSLLMAFANEVAGTIEVCRLHARLQQQLAEMKSVLAVTRALVTEISLNNLLEFIMIQAEHLTNAEGAVVLLLSDDDQYLEVATPGDSWLRIEPGSRLPVSESLAGLAIASQHVQLSSHARDDDRTAFVRPLLRPTELDSLLCAPLMVQEQSLGVLLVWNRRDGAFTHHDSRLMGLFADHAALALHNARLHARNRQLAIDQERHRLAQELHDTVSQSLYSIALAAQTSLKLLGQANTDDGVKDPVEYILSLSKTALDEMRNHLYNLYPTALVGKRLAQALAQHCDTLKEQHALAIDLTIGAEPTLSADQREALYYIARESLWNVVKHANATRVDVSLTTDNGQAILSIQDDGTGFDPLVPVQAATFGLRNMEERANLVGGTFELRSGPGQGTRVTAQLPVWPSGK